MAMSKTYLTVNGKIRSEQRSGESGSRDYVLDGSGSVVGVYRNGWLQADACYEPYGEIYTQWYMGTDGYRFTWGGGFGYRQTFTEWSSVYVRARHYSKAVGSWLSADPLWPNEMPYGYVEGRVPGSVDPSGNITYKTKNCDGRMQTDILSHVRKNNASMQGADDTMERFKNCLNVKSSHCYPQIMHMRQSATVLESVLNNNDRSKVNFTIECVKCKSAKCGFSNIDRKRIYICVPYNPVICGPLQCTILHEMIHVYIQILDFPVSGDDTVNPFGCLDEVPGCMGQR